MKISKLLRFLIFSKHTKALRSKEGRHLARTLVKSAIKIKKMK